MNQITTWFQSIGTTTPLAGGASYTSSSAAAFGNAAICIAVLTDVDGTLQIQFSPDATNWDSTLTFSVSGNINEVHRATVTRPFFRVKYTNGSGAQSFMRLTVMGDNYVNLTAPFNQSTQQDADANLVKAISDEILISNGLLTGYSITNKFGYNPDVDTGSTPEDIWDGGSVYTGFPNGAAETVQVFSSDANDTSAGTGARTITFIGLDANYNVQSETVTLNGTTPVTSVSSYVRVHTAFVASVGSSNVNAGTITIRHSTTTANVFQIMRIGTNQTNSSGYTVPAGYTAYMRNIHAAITDGATAASTGYIYTRSFGSPFRQRRPFFISTGFSLDQNIFGGLSFTEKSDLILRIATVGTNNSIINGGYDLLLVKN